MKTKNLFLAFAAIMLLGATMPIQAQKKTSGQKTFILKDGKLGPLYIGQSMNSIPQSFPGLYDKCVYKHESGSDDMDGDWTIDYYQFYKNGKKVFTANFEDNKLYSFTLGAGSSYIKTPEGYYVGYSARELYKKTRHLVWNNAYEGFVYVTSGRFTYNINSDMLKGEFPSKVTDFKSNAKINSIDYR